jgi:GNAT superfamily N-acetyltransferase
MTALPRGVVITEVTATEPKLETLRALLREYLRSDAVTRRADDYAGELADLPGAYSAPAGCLLLAELGGLPAGCVALRPLDGKRCEMKRLYVRAAFRGAGLAGILVEHVIERARAQGYREMYLDTMPKMRAARLMYDMLGFKACAPYLAEPTPGADCLVLELGKA